MTRKASIFHDEGQCASPSWPVFFTLSISRSLAPRSPSRGGKGSSEPGAVEFGSILASMEKRAKTASNPSVANGSEQRKGASNIDFIIMRLVKLWTFSCFRILGESEHDSVSLCDYSRWLNLKCEAAAQLVLLTIRSLCVVRGKKWTCRPRTQIQSPHMQPSARGSKTRTKRKYFASYSFHRSIKRKFSSLGAQEKKE